MNGNKFIADIITSNFDLSGEYSLELVTIIILADDIESAENKANDVARYLSTRYGKMEVDNIR